MVRHTLDAFAAVPGLSGTLVVVAPGDDFLNSNNAPYVLTARGGATRAVSVSNGLDHLLTMGAHADDWVLVHDAARCLVTPDQINRLIAACFDDAVGGLLAHRLPDTLKR